MKAFFALFMILMSASLNAGTATGTITSIFVSDSSQVVLFLMSTPIKETPRCNEKGMFSISLSKGGGQVAYSAILSAKQNEYIVTATGLNTCSNEWKVEDLKNIELH